MMIGKAMFIDKGRVVGKGVGLKSRSIIYDGKSNIPNWIGVPIIFIFIYCICCVKRRKRVNANRTVASVEVTGAPVGVMAMDQGYDNGQDDFAVKIVEETENIFRLDIVDFYCQFHILI